MVLIKVLTESEELYVRSFDPMWNGDGTGCGKVVLTHDPDLALQFKDKATAFAFWKQQSPTVPVRPDGKPNKPLTAFTVELFDY